MSAVKKLKRRLSLTLRRSRSGINIVDDSISELTEQMNIDEANGQEQSNGEAILKIYTPVYKV